MKLIVTKMLKTHDPKSGVTKTGPNEGKPYTVYDFECDVTVDGAVKSSVKVSTLDQPTAGLVKDGAEFEAREKVWNNITSYLLKPAQKSGGGFKGGGGGGYSREPTVKYTMNELIALYEKCYGEAARIMGFDDRIPNEAASAVQAGAATLLIQATKIGIKL